MNEQDQITPEEQARRDALAGSVINGILASGALEQSFTGIREELLQDWRDADPNRNISAGEHYPSKDEAFEMGQKAVGLATANVIQNTLAITDALIKALDGKEFYGEGTQSQEAPEA